MRKELWLMILMGVIIVALLAIFVFVPAKPVNNTPQQKAEGLIVTTPLANQEVSFPMEIKGYIDGKNNWTGFEGQVGTVKLIDRDGVQVAGPTPLTAVTDWMKFPTQFILIFDFAENVGYIPEGTLVFRNENPSGDPVRDRTFSIPIKIKAERSEMIVRPFFAKNEITGSTCSVVFPVSRLVPKSQAVARAALEELLKGPTEEERAWGYYSNINSGVKIQSLVIDETGTAKVDFSNELETTGGSCRVTEIRSEITFTLKQFPTIKNVIISIDGRTEDILQP